MSGSMEPQEGLGRSFMGLLWGWRKIFSLLKFGAPFLDFIRVNACPTQSAGKWLVVEFSQCSVSLLGQFVPLCSLQLLTTYRLVLILLLDGVCEAS